MGYAISYESTHFEFLDDVKTMLKSMTSKKLPCLDGWLLDINALYLLRDDLHNNHNVKSFITNRLNQDCADNLFSVIRGKHSLKSWWIRCC